MLNPDTANEVTQVSGGGPLSISGEDYFAGEFTAEEGDCIQDNSNTIFELEVVVCP